MKKLLLISLLAVLLSTSLVAASFSLSSNELNYSVCSGVTTIISTQVEGTGDFNVNNSGQASLFTTTVPGSFSLSDGMKNVYSYINPPSNTEKQVYVLEVEVNHGAETQTESYNIEVKDCQGSTLTIVPNKNSCACEEIPYSIKVNNLGTTTETFDLSVKGVGEEWTTLTLNKLTVNAGEGKAFTAFVQPPCNVHGDYEIEFEAKGEDSTASGTTELKIKSCYEYNLEFEASEYKLCEDKAITLNLTLSNNGKDNTFDLISKDLDLVFFNESVAVNSNENASFMLIVKPKTDSEGKIELKVLGLSKVGEVEETASTNLIVEKCNGVTNNLSDEEENICDLDEEGNCYETELSSKKELFVVGLEEGLTFNILLKNDGLSTVEYKISLEGDAEEFSLIDPDEVKLGPGEEEELSLFISPPLLTELGEYTLEIKAKVKGTNTEFSNEFTVKVVEEVTEEDTEEMKEQGFFSKLWAKVISLFKSPLEEADEEKEVEEVEEEEVETSDEEVEEGVEEEKEGFFAKIFSLFKFSEKDVTETTEIEEVVEETEEETNETVEENTEVVIEEETEVVEEESNETVVEENNETVEEVAEKETSEEEEVKETEEETSDSGKEVVIGNTTVKIDLDSLGLNEKKVEKSLFDYKLYLGGALLIIAIIILLSTGILKKVVDFFEEE